MQPIKYSFIIPFENLDRSNRHVDEKEIEIYTTKRHAPILAAQPNGRQFGVREIGELSVRATEVSGVIRHIDWSALCNSPQTRCHAQVKIVVFLRIFPLGRNWTLPSCRFQTDKFWLANDLQIDLSKYVTEKA